MKKILMTGGTGKLGKFLLKLNKNYIIDAPSRQEMNISEYSEIENNILKTKPDIILHCAAFTNVSEAQTNYIDCIKTNIIGTANIALLCNKYKIRMIYISTDYVFDGKDGNYDIDDKLNPLSKYAISKVSGEFITKMTNSFLIIRTTFFGEIFPYEYGYVNQYTSKNYIDIIAPMILDALMIQENKTLHIGTERKSLFELAKIRKQDIKPIVLISKNVPRDTSFSKESLFYVPSGTNDVCK